LSQAINNIIDNAEKYSPSRPHIVVTTKDHKDGIEINVIDEGIGIASNMKTRVFEKFFRVRTGDVHTVKGFGLGLSFVKDVVHTHRGKINLISEVNRGTEVRIFLPKV
jgi:two-component system phosphate regulon sensor histidine kinase PhoR